MESLHEDQGELGTHLNDKAFTKHALGQECNHQHHQEGTRMGWRVELELKEKSLALHSVFTYGQSSEDLLLSGHTEKFWVWGSRGTLKWSVKI